MLICVPTLCRTWDKWALNTESPIRCLKLNQGGSNIQNNYRALQRGRSQRKTEQWSTVRREPTPTISHVLTHVQTTIALIPWLCCTLLFITHSPHILTHLTRKVRSKWTLVYRNHWSSPFSTCQTLSLWPNLIQKESLPSKSSLFTFTGLVNRRGARPPAFYDKETSIWAIVAPLVVALFPCVILVTGD